MIFLILPPDLAQIGAHMPQNIIKIPLVLNLRINLGFIIPFTVDYSYLQVDL